MIINSPSAFQFIKNQEKPELDLEPQLEEVQHQQPIPDDIVEDDQEYDPTREDAHIDPRYSVTSLLPFTFIHSIFLGIQLTLETVELAIQLQTYLTVKDSSFKNLVSLFYIHTLEELRIEEEKLEKEYHFFNVPSDCELFNTLVLSRIKKEAKELNIDLKPLYVDQAEFYNMDQFEGEVYSPICSQVRSP